MNEGASSSKSLIDQIPQSSPSGRKKSSRPRLPFLVVGILFVVVVGALAWAKLPAWRPDTERFVLHEVERRDLEVVILERGYLEAARNEDLLCEIESRGPGSPAASIKWIMHEGYLAHKGDLLVEFDSSSFRDQVDSQQILIAQAKASLTTSEAELKIVESQNESDFEVAETNSELAEIDLKKYLQGDYIKEKRSIEGNLLIAQEERKRAKERLNYSQRLKEKGFVSTGEVESDELAVTRAENDLAIAHEELRVLEDFTKPRTVKDLENKYEESQRALDRVRIQSEAKEAQALAQMLADTATYEKKSATLRRFEEQLGKCKLYATIDGMVTYANRRGGHGVKEVIIEEGTNVRERQKIIRIPDLSSIQVNVKVHESKVSLLKLGQPARIRVESMPNRVLQGKVWSIASMADAQSKFASGVQLFTVLVSIDEEVEGLKPGMTAEVEILAQKIPNVLSVPIQTVFERNGQNYCYVTKPGGSELTAISIGDNNDKFVVVKSGLKKGDLVVQNFSALLSDVDLGRLNDSIVENSSSETAWANANPSPQAPPGEAEPKVDGIGNRTRPELAKHSGGRRPGRHGSRERRPDRSSESR